MFGGGAGTGRQVGMIAILAAIVVLFQALTGGMTLNPANLISLVSQYSYILILAIGMVMVIIAGHIDLSVGSVAAFVGIVVANLMQDTSLPWPFAVLAGLGVGALIGAWHGFWVAYVGVPAFIVTLAGLLFFRGANQFVGNAETIPVPQEFRVIGSGFLPEVGPDTGYNNLTLLLGAIGIIALAIGEVRLRRRQQERGAQQAPRWVSALKVLIGAILLAWASMLFASGRVGTSFPVSGIILLGLAIVYTFLMKNTVFGRSVYAVGGNAQAARLSGVKTKRVNFLVMMNMSVLAALAGMIYVARAAASGPQDGLNWEFDAISAVFIGGAAVAGGVGTVSGSIVGGLVMAVLNNGLQLLGVGTDRVQMIKGLVILAAVAVDIYNRRQGRASLIGRWLDGPRTTGTGGGTGGPTRANTPAGSIAGADPTNGRARSGAAATPGHSN
ncbi:sugar ABC transporter permease [Kineococcus glutinatus]|uniref:Xylose transport system permease protein XylH n=2 Tax=Kineococcus glutinatus TaxID=1070872 RepID=A0ABP9H9Y8_9ACTN